MSEKRKEWSGLSQAELKADMLDMIKRNDAAKLRANLEAMTADELRARAIAVAELLKERA